MKLQSLGLRSELIFTDFDGQVEDRGAYLVVRTLTNPNFFWGNLLIFDRPPQISDFEEWTALFKKEFTDPSIYHMTFAWDSPQGIIGEISRFEANGFELEKKIVLATSSVNPPPKINHDLIVKPIHTDREWDQMMKIQVDSAHDHLPRHEWESFYRSQSVRYREMAKAEMGYWFGGFLGDRLVGGLGVFHNGEIGRYQQVCTHPDYLRRGICGTLVYESGRYALSRMGLKQLVMCADPEYHAARIYESVGFKQVQTEHGVYWWDRNRN